MNPPTLLAYRDGPQLKVWCEHEKTWHYHGAVSAEFGAGDGHRTAHCTCERSPFYSGGYFLKEVDAAPPKMRCTNDARCKTCR